jgi:hypothetical protein
MPRISEFFGLTIYMYWFDNQKHSVAHFHVRYQGAEAVFALNGARIEGNLGPRVDRLVLEWCDERRAELQQAWSCAMLGQEIPWILPLQ